MRMNESAKAYEKAKIQVDTRSDKNSPKLRPICFACRGRFI